MDIDGRTLYFVSGLRRPRPDSQVDLIRASSEEYRLVYAGTPGEAGERFLKEVDVLVGSVRVFPALLT